MSPEAVEWKFLLLSLAALFIIGILMARKRRLEIPRLVATVKIYLKNKRPAEALRELEKWKGTRTTYPTELGLLYLEALVDAADEARTNAFLEAFPTDGLDLAQRYKFARGLESLGRAKDAEEHYRKIQKADPEYADVPMRLARAGSKSPSDGAVLGLDPNAIPKHLATKYRGMELVGKGGMGFVFKAFDIKRKRTVAVKVLSPFLKEEKQAMDRFLREAKLLTQFEHPNVVKIFDVEEQPITYYSMEFVKGRSLGHRLEEEGALPVPEVLAIAQGVLAGLVQVHKAGVVHRDIKPENILLDENGTPRLTDFGLAVATNATRITQTGQVMGTLRYMPPEQLRGEETGPPGDLFSLGVTMFELLTGVHAFSGEDRFSRTLVGKLTDVAPKPVPPGLVSLVELLMESRPEDRVATAQETLQMVRELRREIGRKGPASFVEAAVRLRDRAVKPLSGYFSGLSNESGVFRNDFFNEVSNVRDLKMLIWTLNESLDQLTHAGASPPSPDPRPWTKELGNLLTDLARFVRKPDMLVLDALALRLRKAEKMLAGWLEAFRLQPMATVAQVLAERYKGQLMMKVPTAEIEVYGAPDPEAARGELRTNLQVLIEGGRPALQELDFKLGAPDDDGVWLVELRGPGVDREHVKASLLFEAMGAGEVGFQEAGVFKVWLPLVLEDPLSRQASAAAPPAAAQGGAEVVEDPAAGPKGAAGTGPNS